MLSQSNDLLRVLDQELIAFLTAVSPTGQPQSSPVWFVRDGEDIVVYNRPDTPRLVSIAVNPKVALSLRCDGRANAVVGIEGEARAEDLPLALDFPGYLEKYGREIERFGWTPASFSADYRAGLRIDVTRVRYRGLRHVLK